MMYDNSPQLEFAAKFCMFPLVNSQLQSGRNVHNFFAKEPQNMAATKETSQTFPIPSMYGIVTYIYHKESTKYTIHLAKL